MFAVRPRKVADRVTGAVPADHFRGSRLFSGGRAALGSVVVGGASEDGTGRDDEWHREDRDGAFGVAW
jgi:hypothetical protein